MEEVGCLMSEVGSPMSEVRSPKSEVGIYLNLILEFELVFGVGSRNTFELDS